MLIAGVYKLGFLIFIRGDLSEYYKMMMRVKPFLDRKFYWDIIPLNRAVRV